MLLLNHIPRKQPGIIARRAGDEYVLVPVTENIADMTSMYTLNETGAFIYDRIDGVASAGDIACALAAEYGEDTETTRRDVLECLAGLEQYNIITT
ncbi:MAG: PqqD family protein [Bacteroidetes bacterium]|nr:PqqD family protein [Bacteroidota bacterium]